MEQSLGHQSGDEDQDAVSDPKPQAKKQRTTLAQGESESEVEVVQQQPESQQEHEEDRMDLDDDEAQYLLDLDAPQTNTSNILYNDDENADNDAQGSAGHSNEDPDRECPGQEPGMESDTHGEPQEFLTNGVRKLHSQ